MNGLHPSWADQKKIVIGMLHLPALPGAPLSKLKLDAIRDFVSRDLAAFLEGGVDGLMMENFGDVPFYPGRVPEAVAEQMTMIAADIRKQTELPLGINVLRNDGLSALTIAHEAKANFVRVNVLSGARVTDQGIIQGIAHDLLRERARLKAEAIKIFADVDVKHSAPLAVRPLKDEVDDLIERALADAIVVSGAGTGKATDLNKVRDVKRFAAETPVFVGSGVTPETIRDFAAADGFIVGTAVKQDGVVSFPVESTRVKALMAAIR